MLEYLANPEGSLWKEQELRNPGEVTRMLFALSGDRRYLEYVPFMETGGGKRMCEALDKAERTGIEKGIHQGIQQGIQQGKKKAWALIKCLYSANRIDDLQRAADDPVFREQLFKEFSIK